MRNNRPSPFRNIWSRRPAARRAGLCAWLAELPRPSHRGGLMPAMARGLVVVLGLVVAHARAASDDQLHPLTAQSHLHHKLDAVGMIISGYGSDLSIATGFMVSPCHVLTAGHVVAPAGRHVQRDSSVRFVPSQPGRPAVAGRIVAASPAFVTQTAPTGFDPDRIGNDWALVELDQAIADIAPIKLLYPPVDDIPQATFSVAGYPLGQRQPGLAIQENCRNWHDIHPGLPLGGVLIVDCAVRQGMSGGPLLLDDREQVIAAGIITERFVTGGKVMTVAIPIAHIADTVNDALHDSDICAAGSAFAVPSRPAPDTR